MLDDFPNSLIAQLVKNPPAIQETTVGFLGGGDLPHFFSIQVFKRLIRATCIREGNLLYSVY